MLALDTTSKKTNNEKSESIDLINTYLKTLSNETFNYKSAQKVKGHAKGIIAEYASEGTLDKIKYGDVKKAYAEVKDVKKDYGFRAFLNYYNRGFVQGVAEAAISQDIPASSRVTETAKLLVGMGAAAVATGSVAQALFGPVDYDKYFGASFEQLAKNFMLGNEHFNSLVPPVATAVAAVGAAKLGVSFIAAARSEKEAESFSNYVDLKHAQIGLKQLKKAVKKQSKENTSQKAHSPGVAAFMKTAKAR